MSVGRVHRWALGFTVALPVAGLLSGSSYLLVAGILLGVGLVFSQAGFHDFERSRLRRGLVHGLTLVGLAAAGLIWRQSRIDAGLLVVMLGIFNRFALRVGHRDDLIVVGASATLLAASTIVTPGLAFALIILGFVPAALWALLTASLLGLAERAKSPAERAAAFASYAARPAPAMRGALSGAGLGLMLVGYAAVAFLPRYQFGAWLSPGGFLTFSGAGQRMELSSGGVVGSGGGGTLIRVDMAVPIEGLYARVYALDVYDGAGFLASEGPTMAYSDLKAEGGSCRPVGVKRLVGRREPHPIPALGTDGPSKVVLQRPERQSSGTWVTRIPQGSLDMRYEACLSERAPARWPRMPDRAEEMRQRFLEVPSSVDARIPALARTLVGEATEPEEKLRRILAHFGRGFDYSLDPIEGSSKDPLARFLFEAKVGHCELYAGALALLLRSAGLPARVAAGYYGGYYNRRSGQLELGGEDAHAWVEVLVDDRWRWVDATPPGVRSRRQGKGLAWIRDIWDALDALWYTYVIDFDERRRRALLDGLGQKLGASFSGEAGSASEGLGAARGGAGFVFGALLLLAVGAAVVLLRGRDRLGKLGRRLAKLLRAEGRPLAVAAATLPSGTRAVGVRAVRLYEARRFGPESAAPTLDAIAEAVAELGRASKRVRQAEKAQASSSG